MKPTLILVRHGATNYNKEDRIRGTINIALNEDGLLAAEENARDLKLTGVQPFKIVSSPLRRAIQTAEPILKYLRFSGKLEQASELIPWFLGALEGEKTKDVLDEMFGLMNAPDNLPPISDESFNMFLNRTLGYFEECMNLAIENNGTIIVVSHTRNIRSFLAWEKAGFGDDVDMSLFIEKEDPLGTAGHLICEYEDGQWRIIEIENDNPSSGGGS